MSLHFYKDGYHFNQHNGFLKERTQEFRGFTEDVLLVHFTAWEKDTIFPKIELSKKFGEAELFYGAQTQAYIGRGMDFKNIPEGPNVSVYDCLKPLEKALPGGIEQFFTAKITLKKAGTFTGKIIVGEESLSFTVKISPAKEVRENYSLELWQYPYAVARYEGLTPADYFTPRHEKLVKTNLRRYQKAGGDAIAVTIVEDPWNHQTFDPYPSLVKWEKMEILLLLISLILTPM